MSIVDLNVCRICLNHLKHKDGQSILKNPNILDKFRRCTNLKIHERDGLPSLICGRCNARLKIAYDFRRQALLSDGQLRSFINKINNQFNEVANTTSIMKKTDLEDQLLYEAGYVENNDTNVVDVKEIITEEISEIKIINQSEQQNDMNFVQEEKISIHEDYNEELEMQVEEEGQDETGDDAGNNYDNDDNEWQDGTTVDTYEIEQEKTSSNTANYVLTEITIDPLKMSSVSKTKKEDAPVRRSKSNGSHICVKCNKDFSTSSNLQRHLDIHDGVRRYQCTLCGKGFTQNGSLKKHLLIHSGEKPHKCDVCGRGFTQHTTLVFHMRRHTGERPFGCDQCGRAFRMKDALKRHINEHHTDSVPKVHICSICNRGLRTKYSLQMHLKRHSDHNSTEEYRCDQCNKIFKTKISLDAHTKRHFEIRIMKCEQCNQEFDKKKELLSHLKTHVEIKPYECEECDKSFTTEKLLKEHVEFLHRNNTVCNEKSKIYQCEICKKQYKIKENLIQHLKTHDESSTTMYSCDECGVAFDLLRRYKLHRVNKHNENIKNLNECYICNIPFVSVKDLNSHLEIKHDSVDENCDECNQHFASKRLYDNHMLEHQLEIS